MSISDDGHIKSGKTDSIKSSATDSQHSNRDQANINNAYVSGMKEALGMHGNELTYASNVFTAGYVISQIPAVILVTRVRPSYIISTLEILWAVFTFCAASVKTVPQLYAIRFLVGLCEGAFFPTIIYLIASWYTKSERGKRVTLFYSTATLSQMFSGYLQAGAYDGLNGKMGRAGWQWLFIIVSLNMQNCKSLLYVLQFAAKISYILTRRYFSAA